jgi:uncharacterized protein (DUF608 family)
MKVYLAYVDNGCQGDKQIVGDVFDTRRKALDYVIKKEYSGDPFYDRAGRNWLDMKARCHVVEMEVK